MREKSWHKLNKPNEGLNAFNTCNQCRYSLKLVHNQYLCNHVGMWNNFMGKIINAEKRGGGEDRIKSH